ncbi:MAG: response regulator [SAR202 cluster bacterium]|nr:response regulator [SAR202 cluster bacterium]
MLQPCTRILVQSPQFGNIGVATPDGNLYCRAAPLASAVNVSDRAYFQRAVTAKNFAVGDYLIGRVTGRASLTVGYPTYDESGEMQSLLFAAIDLGWLNDGAAASGLPDGSEVFAADTRGSILARFPDSAGSVGKALSDFGLPAESLASGNPVTGLDGTDRLYSVEAAHYQVTTIYFAGGIPASVVFAGANAEIARDLLALAGIVVLTAAAAWFTGGFLVLRPIREISIATRALSAGDLSSRARVLGAAKELDQLAASFNEMANTIESRDREVQDSAKAIKAANAKLNAVVDASPIGIASLDAKGNIVIWNRSAQVITGWTVEDAVGRPLPITVDEKPVYGNGLAAALRDGKTVAGTEIRARRKDGAPVDLNMSAAPLRGPGGSIEGAIVMMTDVTEKNRLRDQLVQSQKVESIGWLAAGVAHDFNNLLVPIMGYAELVSETMPPGDRAREDLNEISRAAEQARNLTRQLLAFSRQQVMEPQTFDLNQLILDMDKLFQRVIGENIELTSLPAEGIWPVCADPGQIQQVLMNLVVNARDAMHSGGKITVETSNAVLDDEYVALHPDATAGEHVMLAVTDTGTGMTDEVKRHLFEPFFTTKERGKGTGLGLATCHGIIRQSGGTIWVYSELGRGTTFKVYLPRAQGAPQATRVEAEYFGGGNETVLVVEDDDRVRRVAVRTLSEIGYRVHEAWDSESALAVFYGEGPSIALLVTDVVMPGSNGRELADGLRRRFPSLKVLFMTGYTDDTVIRHVVLEQGAAVLQKPFTPRTLAKRVRQVLDTPIVGHG